MSESKEINGNVGEWSEIYTLLKLLGEGKVYAGDQNLEKIKNLGLYAKRGDENMANSLKALYLEVKNNKVPKNL